MSLVKVIAERWTQRVKGARPGNISGVYISPVEAYEAGFDYAFHQVFLKLWDEDKVMLDSMQELHKRLKHEPVITGH
jgi:hypothetical protein